MTSKVVAIDGTSYVGKSTIARCLAALRGYAYINTGHMFRSVAKMCLDRKIASENIEDVLRLAEGMEFAFRKEGDRYLTVVDGEDWTDRLDDYEVVLAASKLATIGKLREILLEKQRQYARKETIVMEGRDIGTVVFPDAAWKFFVTASAEVRAKRMFKMMTAEQKAKVADFHELIPKVQALDEPVILFSVVAALGLFVGLPHLLTALLGYSPASVSFHLVDGLIKAAIFVAYVAAIGLFEDIRRVFMYHGAEHKAIFTYEKGLDMTVENARAQTRFHPRCGTSFLFIVILVSILLFAVTLRAPLVESRLLDHALKVLIKVPLLLPVAGLSYEILRLSARFPRSILLRTFAWPGLLLQGITTREPTDDQLEVALLAIEKTLWRERIGMEPSAPEPEVEVFPSFEAARAGMG